MSHPIIEALVASYVGLFEALLRWLAKHVRHIRIGPLDVELRTRAEREFGATLAKIEAAQANLSEAIEAIDEVKEKYTKEQAGLDRLIEQVNQKRAEYQRAVAELDTTNQLLEEDQERLRAVLGLNERRTKIAGFLSGVFASLVAAALWVGVPYLWRIFF